MPKHSSDGDSSPGSRQGEFARRLTRLFETKTNPDTGAPYTNNELSRIVGLSPSTIAQLKQGTKDNPTKNTIEALAQHFGVEPGYFFHEMSPEHEDRVIAGLKLLDAAENAGVQTLATRMLAARADGLSAGSLEMIASVIETARKAEGLDGRSKG